MTILSDKYQIPALYRDICVESFLSSSDPKNFAAKRALEKCPRDFNRWKFAARYRLLKLEQYQREEATNWEIIKHILKRDDGLSILLHGGIPLDIVGKSVALLAINTAQGNYNRMCVICGVRGEVYNGVCEACKDKALQSIKGT
jgi:hypothetical protein